MVRNGDERGTVASSRLLRRRRERKCDKKEAELISTLHNG
jgi:hypothetical protein